MERQLRDAVLDGDLPSVRQILRQPGGVNVNAGNKYGFAALHFAASRGHLAIVQAILQVNGVNVNARTEGAGCTPLHLAGRNCHANQLPILQALLQAGADPNAANHSGYTPLFDYIINSCCPISTVEALLDAGANPLVLTNNLDTPLHIACLNGRLEAVQLLLQRQGSECLTWTNFDLNTPLNRPDPDFYSIPVGVVNSIRRCILQAYARMVAQQDDLFSLHSVLHAAKFLDGYNDEEFELPVGKLNLEDLHKLLEYIIAAEPGSVVALDSDGLLPLQVAIELNFPASVLYVLLRPYPDMLFHTSFPLHHPQGWLQ